MKKLKLQAESLRVESFSTQAAAAHAGTVLGHSGFSCNTFDDPTCRYYQTCGGLDTCDGMATCNPQCWPQESDPDRDPADPGSACCTIGCG